MTFQTGGRVSPTRYTAELAERILRELRTGRSLLHVCKDEGIPPDATVRTWVIDDREGFAARYRRAREAGAKALADRRFEIFDRILRELTNGRTLSDVCRDDGMPVVSTVLAWASEDRARYDQARELGYQAMSDEILDISADCKRNKTGNPTFDRQNIARARLRIDVRRWRLAKALPKTYGKRPHFKAPREDGIDWAELLKAVDGKTRGLPNKDNKSG